MQIHIIPASIDYDTVDCISFTADIRDAATLIHSYLCAATQVPSVLVIRGSRKVIITRDDCPNSEQLRGLVSILFTGRADAL